MTGRLLDWDATAEYLGITVRHLKELHYRRAIPAVKVGRKVRFDLRDLDRWIEDHKTQAAS